jgi:hypothetical protein
MGQETKMARNVMHRVCSVFFLVLCGLTMALGLMLAGCARHTAQPVAAPASAADAQSDAACSATPAGPDAPPLACPGETAYDRGVRAYDAGKFKKAVAAWREAADHGDDPAVRQRALFALAAVKLAQAGNETELAAALDLFDTWEQNALPGGSGEDPRFLVPVVRTFKPAFAVKEAKSAAEKECIRRLTVREEQVRRGLQQQVRALETIHREIQEKKKGLTNY